MLINLFHVALLGLLFLYTLRGSRCAATRRLSLVPLAMCGMEIFLAGVLDTLAFPVLGVLLVLARAAVAVCCVLARTRIEAPEQGRRLITPPISRSGVGSSDPAPDF